MFDMQHLMKEWKVNNINDRSFRCIDPSFFDDNADFWQKNQKLGESDQPNQGIRHGVYATSSKDWEKIKPMMIEETNKMREAHLNKLKEKEQAMTKEELEQHKKDKQAEEVKRKILPTKVKVQEEDAFGFVSDQEEQEEEQQALDEKPDLEDLYGEEADAFDDNCGGEEEDQQIEEQSTSIQDMIKQQLQK